MTIIKDIGLNEVGSIFFDVKDLVTNTEQHLSTEFSFIDSESYSDPQYFRFPLNLMSNDTCDTTSNTQNAGNLFGLMPLTATTNSLQTISMTKDIKDVLTVNEVSRVDELDNMYKPMTMKLDATSIIKKRDITDKLPSDSNITAEFYKKLVETGVDISKTKVIKSIVIGQILFIMMDIDQDYTANDYVVHGVAYSTPIEERYMAYLATYEYDWVNGIIVDSNITTEKIFTPYDGEKVFNKYITQEDTYQMSSDIVWGYRTNPEYPQHLTGEITLQRHASSIIRIELTTEAPNTHISVTNTLNSGTQQSITKQFLPVQPAQFYIVISGPTSIGISLDPYNYTEPMAIKSASTYNPVNYIKTIELINSVIAKELELSPINVSYTSPSVLNVVRNIGELYPLDPEDFFTTKCIVNDDLAMANDYLPMFFNSNCHLFSVKNNVVLTIITNDTDHITDNLQIRCLGASDSLDVSTSVNVKKLAKDSTIGGLAGYLVNGKYLSVIAKYIALPFFTARYANGSTFGVCSSSSNSLLEALGYFSDTMLYHHAIIPSKITDKNGNSKVIAIAINEDLVADDFYAPRDDLFNLRFFDKPITGIEYNKILSSSEDPLEFLIIRATQTTSVNKTTLLADTNSNIYVEITHNLGSNLTLNEIVFESYLANYTLPITANGPYQVPSGVYGIHVTYTYHHADNTTTDGTYVLPYYGVQQLSSIVSEYISIAPPILKFSNKSVIRLLPSNTPLEKVTALAFTNNQIDDVTDLTNYTNATEKSERTIATDIDFTTFDTSSPIYGIASTRLSENTLLLSNKFEANNNLAFVKFRVPMPTVIKPIVINNTATKINLVVDSIGGPMRYTGVLDTLLATVFEELPEERFIVGCTSNILGLGGFMSTYVDALVDGSSQLGNIRFNGKGIANNKEFNELNAIIKDKPLCTLTISPANVSALYPDELFATIQVYGNPLVLADGVVLADVPTTTNEVLFDIESTDNSMYFETDGVPFTDDIAVYNDLSNQFCMHFNVTSNSNGGTIANFRYSDYIFELNNNNQSATADIGYIYPMYTLIDFNYIDLSKFNVTLKDGTVIDTLDSPHFSGRFSESENQETRVYPFDKNRLFMLSYDSTWFTLSLADFLTGNTDIVLNIAVLPTLASTASTDYSMFVVLGDSEMVIQNDYTTAKVLTPAIPQYGSNTFTVTRNDIDLSNKSVNDYIYVNLVSRRTSIDFTDDSTFNSYEYNYQFYVSIKLV